MKTIISGWLWALGAFAAVVTALAGYNLYQTVSPISNILWIVYGCSVVYLAFIFYLLWRSEKQDQEFG